MAIEEDGSDMFEYLQPLSQHKEYKSFGILKYTTTIGSAFLTLDFIHRLVCGRQKIPQRFGDWICLRPQVDFVGFFVFHIEDDG
jgi:hypothetical protein